VVGACGDGASAFTRLRRSMGEGLHYRALRDGRLALMLVRRTAKRAKRLA